MLFRSDRKSTRLNSSHLVISYAVFCLKKKTAPEPVHAAEETIELDPVPDAEPIASLEATPEPSPEPTFEFIETPAEDFFLMKLVPPKTTLFPLETPFQ